MDKISAQNYIINIKKFKKYLEIQDIEDPAYKKVRILNPCARFFINFGRKIANFFNMLFGDHLNYNTKNAHALIEYFIKELPKGQAHPDDIKRIQKLYKQLSHVKKGKGTYADGLDAKALFQVSVKNGGAKIQNQYTPLFLKEPNMGTVDEFQYLPGLAAPSLKMLFHIHANKFGKSSELEGTTTKSAMQFLLGFLKEKNDPQHAQLIEKLEIALELEDSSTFVNNVKQRILDSFQTNKALLLPGGWAGEPGHAVYYEVIPETATTGTFRIYNLGEGVNNNDEAVIGLKKKSVPYVDWKGIQLANLTSNHFLAALSEIHHQVNVPNSFDKTLYHNADVFVALKQMLQPTGTIEGKAPDFFMSTQEAGICAWRSLMAFLATYLGKAEYKKLKREIKLQALIQSVKQADPSAEQWRVTKKSFAKMNRSLLKAHERKQVSDQYLLQVQPYLKQVKQWLKDCKSAVNATPEVFTFFDTPGGYVVDNQQEKISKDAFNATTVTNSLIQLEPFHFHSDNFKSLVPNDAKNMLHYLGHAEKYCQHAWTTKEDLALQQGSLRFISDLPVERSFWDQVAQNHPEQLQELIEKLGSISQFFFKSCFTVPQADAVMGERIYALQKLMAIQMLLARKAAPKEFSHLWSTHLGWQTKLISLSTKKMQDEFSHLYNYSYGVPKQHFFDGNYEFDSSKTMNESSKFIFSMKPGANTGNPFVDVVKALSPETIAAIPDFETLSPHEQNARLFASQQVPAWLKSMKENAMALLYLYNEPVATPANVDRSTFGNWEFKVETDQEQSKVKMQLSGVTGQLLQDYPHLKHERDAGRVKFQKTIRPFISAEMKEFYEQYSTSHDEKGQLSHIPGGKKLPKEDFKELEHLFLSESSFAEGLAFFVKKSDKLKDPDYQVLFQMLLAHSLAASRIEKNAELKKKLIAFLDNHFAIMAANNEIQTSVFLLQMRRYFANRLSGIPAGDNLHHLKQLLQKPGLSPEERSVVFAEMAASLGEKEHLSAEEAGYLLAGRFYQKLYPVPVKWEDGLRDWDAQKAFHKHAKRLSAVLDNDGQHANDALLNYIANTILPSFAPAKWICKYQPGTFPSFITVDGAFGIYPAEAQLVTNKPVEQAIPCDIREMKLFKQLYAGVEQGTKLGMTYKFKDKFNNETMVKKSKDELLIVQARQDQHGKLYQHIPQGYFSFMTSRWIKEEYSHWKSIDDPNEILVVNDQTGKCEYAIQLEYNNVKSIMRLSDGYKLGSHNAFSNFEKPEFSHIWFSNHMPAEISFPRFGLDFTYDAGKFASKQHKGFYTDSAKLSKLGSFNRYLLLKNDKGERKVLIPYQSFKAPVKKDALKPNYDIQNDTDEGCSKPQKHLIYRVDASGALQSKSKEGNLYLALVYTMTQDYKKAANYLRKQGLKTTPYTEAEANILTQIVESEQVTGDTDPEAAGLRTFAAFLLLKNSQQAQKQLQNGTILATMAETYKRCLTHNRHVTHLRLKRHEEVFLLKNLLQVPRHPIFFDRLVQLDRKSAPAYAKQVQPIVLSKESMPAIYDGTSFTTSLKYVKGKPFVKPPNILLTRIEKDLSRRNCEYYELAKNGSAADKLWLQNALLFVAESKDSHSRRVAAFLQCVLQQPGEFDDLPVQGQVNQAEINKNWTQKQIDRADSLIKKQKQPQPVQTKKNYDAYLPAEKIEKKAFPPIKLDYKFTSKASLVQEAQHLFVTVPDQKFAGVNHDLYNHLEKWKKGEQLHDKELNHLKEDVVAYDGQTPAIQYALSNPAGLHQLNAVLHITNKVLADDLLALANAKPTQPHDRVKKNVELWGGSLKKITLDDLLINFGQQDPNALRAKNPYLSEKEINELYAKAGEYLLQATYEQHKQRATVLRAKLTHAQANGASPQEVNELLQQLATETLAKRAYDPMEKPAYLVFEYFADIMIRKDQVDKLGVFLETGDLNPVMEMIMGSGKSKVLLPLLGLLYARKNGLSLLIVPSALFESVSYDTQKILQEAFDQTLYSLHFDRHTRFTKHSLELLLDDLTHIVENKQCAIITSKSLQCLVLKFLEEWKRYYEQGQKGDFPEELAIMRRILSVLKTSGLPVLDEVDTLLNVLHEVSFSGGKKATPQPDELKLIGELYRTLYTDPKIAKLAQLESCPYLTSAQVLTTSHYEKAVKPALAQAFVEKLGTIAWSTGNLSGWLNKLNKQDRAYLMAYLTRDTKQIKQAQAFFNKQNPEIQNILSLAGEQICHLLPHTLMRNSGIKYGLEEGQLIASPFLAAGKPNVGSKFANAHITQNYTYQIYAKKGISKDIIVQEMDRLQRLAVKEMAEQGLNPDLKKTKAWEQFCKLKGSQNVPLFNYKESDLQKIANKVNANMQERLYFVEHLILPQMEIFEKKLACNPQNLISIFERWVSGFTGTLWNAKSMHPKIDAVAAKGVDAKTLAILWKNSRHEVSILEEGTIPHMLGQLQNFDLLSDAGGYFKEGSNLEVARQMAIAKKKPVVFYNAQGEQAITDGVKEDLLSHSDVKDEDRLTFLDQSHTTGSDVKQKPAAVGYVTIGRDMLLRDLLQSVWRLRGLDKAQKVKFLISKEVEAIMRQALNKPAHEAMRLDDILRFTIQNQAHQQGTDNMKALNQQLSNIPQQILLTVLLSDKLSLTEMTQAWAVMENLWFKSAHAEPRHQYGVIAEEEDSNVVAEQAKKMCLDKLQSIFTQLPFLNKVGLTYEKCASEAEKVADRFKGCLHAKTINKRQDVDNTVETEQESETQLEVEENQNKEPLKRLQKMAVKGMQKVKDFHEACMLAHKKQKQEQKLPYFSLQSYFAAQKEFKAFAKDFEGIDLTLNVLQWEGHNAQHHGKLFGEQSTPLHFVLVKQGRVIVLSQSEAHFYENDPDLYNLTLGFCNKDRKLEPKLIEKIAKIKFLNGDAQFSAAESKALHSWIKKTGISKLQNMLTKHILPDFPNKALAFQGSDLAKLLNTTPTAAAAA